MIAALPPFSFREVFLGGWQTPDLFWMGLTAVLIGIPCALLGNYLLLRRMALVGDAVSHSVLPGLVLVWLLFHDPASPHDSGLMMVGASIAGLATVLLIDFLQHRGNLRSDAATGIVYTTLFAFGMLLVSRYTSSVDLDAECVLYGELERVPFAGSGYYAGSMGAVPEAALLMGWIAAGVVVLVFVFARALQVTSFDPGMARSIGLPVRGVQLGLMAVLSVVVVTALRHVGLLVVGLLVLPGATAQFLTRRLWRLHLFSVGHLLLSVLAGIPLAAWLAIPSAAAIVVCGGALFVTVWIGTAAARRALAG